MHSADHPNVKGELHFHVVR